MFISMGHLTFNLGHWIRGHCHQNDIEKNVKIDLINKINKKRKENYSLIFFFPDECQRGIWDKRWNFSLNFINSGKKQLELKYSFSN